MGASHERPTNQRHVRQTNNDNDYDYYDSNASNKTIRSPFTVKTSRGLEGETFLRPSLSR
jgi:hypothetical protein